MVLREKIEQIVLPLCQAEGLYLVELKIRGDASRPLFDIYADNENGITLGQCEKLTRAIKDELDMDESFSANYRLNVSSPGLDRPLVEDWEYKKNIGQQLTVKLKDGQEKELLTGKLVDFDDTLLKLEIKGTVQEVPRIEVEQAKVKIKW